MQGKDEILAIIYTAMDSLNDELPEDAKIPLAPDTRLFGADATIDSLSLVSVIVDVETEASDQLGFPVVLTDDRAISQEVSPFTSPGALADYIIVLAAEHG